MKDRQGERKYRKTVRKIIEMKPSKKEKGGNKKGTSKDYIIAIW